MHGVHRVKHVLGILVDGGHRAKVARVAEQHVDGTPARRGGVDERLHRRGPAHIRHAPLHLVAAQTARGLLQRWPMQIGQHDTRTLLQKQPGGRQPDTARPPGNDAHIAFENTHGTPRIVMVVGMLRRAHGDWLV